MNNIFERPNVKPLLELQAAVPTDVINQLLMAFWKHWQAIQQEEMEMACRSANSAYTAKDWYWPNGLLVKKLREAARGFNIPSQTFP